MSKEVPIVKYIFNSYLSGKGMEEIAEELNAANLKTDKKPSGRWHSTMIKYILSNEKYIGDSLVQKNLHRMNYRSGKKETMVKYHNTIFKILIQPLFQKKYTKRFRNYCSKE